MADHAGFVSDLPRFQRNPYRGLHRRDRQPIGVAGLVVPALICLMMLFVGGCGGHPFGGAAAPPKASPPPVELVQVGPVRLHVMATFADAKTRSAGLQYRRLPPGSGAVFTWDGAVSQESFWMIHTPEPLSVLWVRSGKAVGHAEMPQCAMSCPTYTPPAPYDTAVEAPAGSFAHVKPGQEVDFQ